MAAILIIDEHPFTRLGIRSAIEAQRRHVVVGEAGSPGEAVALLRSDVRLVVIDHADATGISLLKSLCPRVAIVIHTTDRCESLPDGVAGMVPKGDPVSSLLEAIDLILASDHSSRPTDRARAAHEALSPRERQVMDMLILGHRPKQIAFALDLSVKTVATHRFRLLRKLGLTNDIALLRYGISHEFPWHEAHGLQPVR